MTSVPAFSPPCGPVTGVLDGPVIRALGIPYARAERFAAPHPVPDRTDPLAADHPAPACPQPSTPEMDTVLGDPIAGLPVDEDCQNLSVTIPADLAPGETLPVLVWIHGGSYVSGAGDSAQYEPTALVAEQRIVFVAVTYRLGVLGYLGGRGRPANLGLLDQLEALRWVQRNIAAFGGDPARVTAAGQSAGGDAVANLMAVAGADTLFSRAIIQSSPFGISLGRQRMAAAMAEAGASIAADAPVADVVAAQPRVAAAAAPFGLRGAMAFGTQYGAEPLPAEDAVDRARDAIAPRIAVLIGSTVDETRLFLPVLPAAVRLASVPAVGGALSSALSRSLTRRVYGAGARRFAERHRRAGGRVRRYEVSFAAPGNFYGAAHAVDIPLLFGRPDTWEGLELLAGITWEQLDAAGREVRRIWADFVRGGDLAGETAVPGVIRFADRPSSPRR